MKKSLPTGLVEFERLQSENYYSVDKTLMIQEFLERASVVTLITRPRRFGKTLNMSMMAEFFDNTKKSQNIFQGTNISKTEYSKEMNQYPVIYLSFASAKGSIVTMTRVIKQQIAMAYQKYEYVFANMDDLEKPFDAAIRKSLSEPESGSLQGCENALLFLMKKIEQVEHKKTMVLIDEYDTPFIEAHVQGYYDEIKSFLSTLLHSTLKDNNHLQYAMLTGIQRVAKENIFSDLNNLVVFTVKDKEYAQYFGFTTEETKSLLEYYDLKLNDDVKSMYNGYNMGGIDIYNPWSLIQYASKKELLRFWVNTSGNTMIKQFMKQSDESFKVGYETLIKQGYLDTQVTMETSFYEDDSTSNLWGLFVNAGYLTIVRINDIDEDEYRVQIPNREILKEFKVLTANYLDVDKKDLSDLSKSLKFQNKGTFIKIYRKLIMKHPSYNDLKDENSYHMFLLGICLYVQNEYDIISNRESGKGRCDIILKAKIKEIPSFVLEFKYTKEVGQLAALASQAVEQITTQKYDQELSGEIIYIGLAHCGKDVEMCWQDKQK